MKRRSSNRIRGNRVIDCSALGDVEANLILRAASVVGGDVRPRELIGRFPPRHRWHNDPVLEPKPSAFEWIEQPCQ
jgi:hypothetical protein